LLGNSPELWLEAQRAVDLWDAARILKAQLEGIKPLKVAWQAPPPLGTKRRSSLRRVTIELVRAVGAEGRLAPGWADFARLPELVYARDPRYCAPSKHALAERLERLATGGGAEQLEAWVARDVDGPLARAGVHFSPDRRDPAGRRWGAIGWFEALPRPDAVRLLLDRALAWLAERGAEIAYGPLDGDTWHRYRFNLGPFERAPFLLEPYNPPDYPELWRESGFAPVEEYFSKRIDAPERVLELLRPKAETARAAGYEIVPFEPRAFEREIGRLHALSRRIFAGNFLYSDLPLAPFQALYAGTRPLVDPRLVAFARAPGGEDAGFLFALPDRIGAVRAMRGDSGWGAKFRFFLGRRTRVAVNVKSAGVLEEHRRHRVAAALMHHVYEELVGAGYRVTNHCLIRAANPSDALDCGVGTPLRRYALYAREIAR
jgi:GNAT superfamily N-acetyltransferase